MTFTEFITIILEALIVALILWEIKLTITKDRREKLEREKEIKVERKLDIGCDFCEEVKKLYPAPPNKEFYLCKTCMEGYLTEHIELTDEQKNKIRSKYRVARAANRKRRKK